MSHPHQARVHALADYLNSAHVLDPSPDGAAWDRALRRVPRHLFVPARAWAVPQDDRPQHLIDSSADADAWWAAVYSNTAIVTQRDGGAGDIADASGVPTSSLSCPYVAVEFLRLMDLAAHHRVLEIGTGTGWTAAMIATRTGDDHVVSVEIDPAVAAAAEANLKSAGCEPLLLVGDGALGAPDHAPYDRIHVTCGIRDIPYAWIEQTRPGGVIVAPWMPHSGGWGEQLRLDVLDDGTAIGRLHGGAAFMMLRGQRLSAAWPPYPDDGTGSRTGFHPHTAAVAWDDGFGLHLAGAAPHLVVTTAGWEQDDNGAWSWITRLRELGGDGWAIAAARVDDPHAEVVQGGRRPLWDDFQAAFMSWARAGRPDRTRFGVTVTRDGQRLWIDSPDRQVAPER